MALTREQVGLIFRLDADAKPASTEIAKFSGLVKTELAALQTQAIARTGVIGERLSAVGLAGSGMGLAIAGAAAVAVGGLFSIAKATADFEGKLVDLSAKSGLTVETLSALDVAAKLSGGSIEQVAQASVILQRNMIAAQQGNKELSAAFRALSVDVSATAEQALPKIFTALKNTDNQAQKTALAMQVFGRSGADLLPIIEATSGNLEDFVKTAREMGLVVGTDAANAADTFGDQLTLLDLQLQGLARTIGDLVIPGLIQMLGLLQALKSDPGGFFKSLGRDLANLPGQINKAAGLPDIFGGPQLAAPGNESAGASPLGNTLTLGQQAVDQAQALAKALKGAAGAGSFAGAGGGSRAKAKAEHDYKLELIQAEQEAVIIAARRETELAERLFRDKALFAADYETIATNSALQILAAQQVVFKAERAEIEKSKADATEKAARLQQVSNDELKAIQKTETEIAQIKQRAREEEKRIADEEFQDQQERDKQRLDQLRDFLRARNQLLEELGRARVDTAQDRASDLEQRAQLQPRFTEAARKARQEAELAELEFQKRMAFIRLNAAEQELLALATTQQQKLEIEAHYYELRGEAAKQFQLRKQQLEDEAQRQSEAQNPLSSRSLLGDSFADGLKETESVMGGFSAFFASWQADLAEQSAQTGDLLTTTFKAITDGLTEMAVAFVLTGETGPAALRQLAAGVLAAIAKMAATKAIFELAEGFAALARGIFGDPRGFAEAGHHFTAAAIYGTIGVVAGIAGRAVAPGGGPQADFSGEQRPGKRTVEQGDRLKPEPQVIIIRASYQPGIIVEEVRKDYQSNGTTRRMLRADLVGEQGV